MPAADAAAWVVSQLTDAGLLERPFRCEGGVCTRPDHDLSVDLGLALAALGGHDATVQTISDAVAADVGAYTRPGHGTVVSAGATAKALALALAAGDDPTSYGGTDLVAQLESTVLTDGVTAGRIHDLLDPDVRHAADRTDTVAQSFATAGLTAVGSDLTDEATFFLLQQQCRPGHFRAQLSRVEETDQSCYGADWKGSTRATAYAVLALPGDGPGVESGRLQGIDWLEEHQDPVDGGWSVTGARRGRTDEVGTGAAARALAEYGSELAAQRAGAWLRGLRLVDVGPCDSIVDADLGAIAPGGNALARARRQPLSPWARFRFLRATTNALVGLSWTTAAPAHSPPPGHPPRPWLRAGTTGYATALHLVPGSTACLELKGRTGADTATLEGRADPGVRLPHGTGVKTGRLYLEDGSTEARRFWVLDRLLVPFRIVRPVIRLGERQQLRIRGLTGRELVSVVFRGRTVVSTEADGRGRATVGFPVTGRPGVARVRVNGEFPDLRHQAKNFRVLPRRG